MIEKNHQHDYTSEDYVQDTRVFSWLTRNTHFATIWV
jgi:hypothetical protein